ncbi:MAG: 50S ribosomal protein L22 [Candidatus Omnitrophica bacterium CG1_02_49_10]|nr:MAG: 50S ribosomal protein L22 [Candidatus Omnitrophica bacterium CG1_02_49_10]
MVSKAHGKFIRVSPRKSRQVAELIKGLDVDAAVGMLDNMNKKPSLHIKKVLESALANAKSRKKDSSALYVSRIIIDEGPSLKRFRARTMGVASPIIKRTSHIYIELDKRR